MKQESGRIKGRLRAARPRERTQPSWEWGGSWRSTPWAGSLLVILQSPAIIKVKHAHCRYCRPHSKGSRRTVDLSAVLPPRHHSCEHFDLPHLFTRLNSEGRVGGSQAGEGHTEGGLSTRKLSGEASRRLETGHWLVVGGLKSCGGVEMVGGGQGVGRRGQKAFLETLRGPPRASKLGINVITFHVRKITRKLLHSFKQSSPAA